MKPVKEAAAPPVPWMTHILQNGREGWRPKQPFLQNGKGVRITQVCRVGRGLGAERITQVCRMGAGCPETRILQSGEGGGGGAITQVCRMRGRGGGPNSPFCKMGRVSGRVSEASDEKPLLYANGDAQCDTSLHRIGVSQFERP